jgi:hypothetical protein
LAILQQLRFEAAGWIFDLIKIVFVGVVAMAAIAFGLGGKEVAAEMLQDFDQDSVFIAFPQCETSLFLLHIFHV